MAFVEHRNSGSPQSIIFTTISPTCFSIWSLSFSNTGGASSVCCNTFSVLYGSDHCFSYTFLYHLDYVLWYHNKRYKISEFGICQKHPCSNTFCLPGLADPTHQTNILSRSGHNMFFLGSIHIFCPCYGCPYSPNSTIFFIFSQGADKTYVLMYNSCITLKVSSIIFLSILIFLSFSSQICPVCTQSLGTDVIIFKSSSFMCSYNGLSI